MGGYDLILGAEGCSSQVLERIGLVLDVYRAEPLLEELHQDLEGTLEVIARAGITNRTFVRQRQAELREVYGHLVSDDNLGGALGCLPVEAAYANFMHILDVKPNDAELREECENILNDFKFPGALDLQPDS